MEQTPKPEGITTLEDVFGPVIHSYTRADMLADGLLVDVSAAARESRLQLPTALTRACYETCVMWTDEDRRKSRSLAGQDERGRLHDVLWMAYVYGLMPNQLNILTLADVPARYTLLVRPRPGRGRVQRQSLQLRLGAGDDGRPCWTIGMRDEDLS